ncbi:hypothetical protein [Nonomuraea jiangxiensis]|uniref:Uncharacterized protein n=1 Tax=Nonomuraea jiangxiensis TaxID=633440 RepID=A0A1G8LE42_9ACTN|nr:hypothetical protein [Nonomuraea jiangxiensis]SDI53747.1 hypothetical protein SAMN05421869_10663 [Nonomuraea jiangxiensis]
MLKNHLRRDLHWLKRQARRDRRVAVCLLAATVAAWGRQFPSWTGPAGSEVLTGISYGLVAGSAATWLVAAYLVVRTLKGHREEGKGLRWAIRAGEGKQWALRSVGAYAAWHLLQFVTALLQG